MNTEPRAETLLFLPGASGDTKLWRPVSERLEHPARRRFFGWPGFGGVPARAGVNGIADLVRLVTAEIDAPVDILAQSMGGIVAVRAVLEKPGLVRHLVLAVTSGGIDVASLGAADWRADFRATNPSVPDWFEAEPAHLSEQLREIEIPVLLLWGDADPISPLAVGQRLLDSLPNAELVVFAGGTHDLILECAGEVAPQVQRHLAKAGTRGDNRGG
jgi:pimeloyl-ACP methyl ester carboxylesterase